MVSKEYEASLKEAFEGFLRSPENQRGLEELTISLGRALDRYPVEGRTAAGTPLHNIFCPEYQEILIPLRDTLFEDSKPLRASDLTILAGLAEYGARQGDPTGCLNLAIAYLNGAGVPQSLHQCLYFTQLAALNDQYILIAPHSPQARFYLSLEEGEREIHSHLFRALYIASLAQLYITMQPHTPNLTLEYPLSGETAEDYLFLSTEYIALLGSALAKEKARDNPTAEGVESLLQQMRSCLKLPFAAECLQKGHDALIRAERYQGQSAMEQWNQAVTYYLSAAIQGNAEAAAGLGYCCERIPQGFDDIRRELAFRWYQHAAKAGSAWAMQRTGEYYQMGLCGPVDREMANRCFELARRMGMPAQT